MAKEQPKFLAVLPWLQLAEEIEVGPFTFWRWPEDAEKYVPNTELRDKIAKGVSERFVKVGKQKPLKKNYELIPLEVFSVVSKKKKPPFVENNDAEALRKAINALSACSLFQTHIKWIGSGEDREQKDVFYKNSTDFFYDYARINRYVTFDDITRRRHSFGLHMATPNLLVKPDECTKMKVGCEDPILPVLGKLIESPETPFSRRLFRVLDLINNAYTDSKIVHPFAEVVLLTTAFETLLIPNYRGSDKSKAICERFLELFKGNESIPHIDKLEGKKEVAKEYPWKGWWLYWFYKLRNDIVHGEEVEPARFMWSYNKSAGTYLNIAVWILRLVIMKLLVKEGIHTETDLDKYQSDKLDSYLSGQSDTFPIKAYDCFLW